MKKNSFLYIVVALIIASFILSYSSGFKAVDLYSTKETKVLKAIDYINKNLLQNATATVGEITEESGVYKFDLTINGQRYTSYLTKDGKILFPQGITLTESEKTEESSSKTTKKSCEEITKVR